MNDNTAHPFKFGARVERYRSMPRSPANDRAYGLAVLAAVNRDNLSRLHKGMAQSWRNRSDEQVKLAYEATMRGEDVGMVDSIHVPSPEFQHYPGCNGRDPDNRMARLGVRFSDGAPL